MQFLLCQMQKTKLKLQNAYIKCKKRYFKFFWLKNPYPQFEERIDVISNAGFEFVMSVFHFSQIFRKSHQVIKMCISDRKMGVSDVRTLH